MIIFKIYNYFSGIKLFLGSRTFAQSKKEIVKKLCMVYTNLTYFSLTQSYRINKIFSIILQWFASAYNTCKYFSYQETGNLVTEKSFFSVIFFIGLTPDISKKPHFPIFSPPIPSTHMFKGEKEMLLLDWCYCLFLIDFFYMHNQ